MINVGLWDCGALSTGTAVVTNSELDTVKIQYAIIPYYDLTINDYLAKAILSTTRFGNNGHILRAFEIQCNSLKADGVLSIEILYGP